MRCETMTESVRADVADFGSSADFPDDKRKSTSMQWKVRLRAIQINVLALEMLAKSPFGFCPRYPRGASQPFAVFLPALLPAPIVLPISNPGFPVIGDIALLRLNLVLEDVAGLSSPQVPLKALCRMGSKMHNAFLTLPSDLEGAPFEVDVFHSSDSDLTNSTSSCIQQLHERTISGM